MWVVVRGNWASSGRSNRARLVTLGRGGVRGGLGKTGILRKGRCVVVGGDNVSPLGCSLLAAASAAGEDVAVGSGDGPNGLFRVAIIWAGGSVPH